MKQNENVLCEYENVMMKELKKMPLLADLYSSLAHGTEDEFAICLKNALDDKKEYTISFPEEFLKMADAIMTAEDPKHKLYMMLFYLLFIHSSDHAFGKLFSSKNKKDGISDTEIVKYLEGKKEKDEALHQVRELEERRKSTTDEKEKEILDGKISALMDSIRKFYEGDEDEAMELVKVRPGDVITFGKYAGHPITWKVLDVDDGKALILSTEILESRRFSNRFCNYAESEIRKWLNGEFYMGFSKEERSFILLSRIDNSYKFTGDILMADANSSYCPDTDDYFFLLSTQEILQYFPKEEERMCKGTSHALHNDLEIAFNDNSIWWMRSMHNDNYAEAVNPHGVINTAFTQDSNRGVRPACWIKVKN